MASFTNRIIISPEKNKNIGAVRYLDDWDGITGTLTQKIVPTPLMAQQGQKPFYEFTIDKTNTKFQELMKREREKSRQKREKKDGVAHYHNKDLNVIYVKPEFLFLLDNDEEGKPVRANLGKYAEISKLNWAREELYRRIAKKKEEARPAKKRPGDRGGAASPPTRSSSPNNPKNNSGNIDEWEKYFRRAAKKHKTNTNKVGGFHLYKRLGVTRKATKRQIKKAYQKIKKKKRKISKRVKEAYRILSNPKTRRKYNNSYHHKKTKKHKGRNQRGCSRKKRRK